MWTWKERSGQSITDESVRSELIRYRFVSSFQMGPRQVTGGIWGEIVLSVRRFFALTPG
jgi:hypothetical protein